MQFIKVKVSLKECPEGLYRTILFREDLNLKEAGYVISNNLNTGRYHAYLFGTEETCFVPEEWLNDPTRFSAPGEITLNNMPLKDMPDEFDYVYDTGEAYEFSCQIMDRNVTLLTGDEDELVARTVDGKGLGIFEGNHLCLDDYLCGYIDPEAEHGKEEYQEKPWNLDMDKFGDFDRELELDIFDEYEEGLEFGMAEYDDNLFPGKHFAEDDDDGELSMDVLETFIREDVAYDIFNDEKVNAKYRGLILKYDINDAYEMIVNCLMEAHLKATSEDLDDEDIDEMYYEAVEELD